MTAAPCAVRGIIDRHFAGAIRPAAEHEMREHLATCEGCRRYYERHLALASLDPAGLEPQIRLARGLGLRPAGRPLWAEGLVALAATAAALLLLMPRWAPVGPGGFTSRGELSPTEPAHLSVFRFEHGVAVPLTGSIHPEDELAFSYDNRAGKQRLMVFGVDEHRHVYWFFPAWQDPSSDPEAIDIEATQQPRELREAVAHRFDGRELTLRAIFTDEALTVRTVERRLEDGTQPLSETGLEQTVSLSIEQGVPR